MANQVNSVEYRARLYERYTRDSVAPRRNISLKGLETSRVAFKGYFGRFLPKDKGAGICDIGCGYGSFLYFLQKEGYTNIYGVDISPEQVEAARRLGIDSVHQGDLTIFLRKQPEKFDCITALDVIEHFQKEEILPLLDAIYQALRPGGTFIMQSPNADGPFGSCYRYYDFSHEVAFTKTSVTQVLRVAGFDDIQIYPTGPIVHGVASAGRWILWQMIGLLVRLYLVAETGDFGGHILTQNLIAVGGKREGRRNRA